MATQNYFKAKNGLEAPSQSTIAVTDSNFPTVRPTLNLDFAGSESVDSRITFTRASAATYFGADGKIKYAVQNEPRIDYDPVTGECKGLLIEEQRTNLLQSSDAMFTSWQFFGNYGLNIIRNFAKAPDGTFSAHRISGASGGSIYRDTTITAYGTYTSSIFIKNIYTTSTITVANYRLGSANYNANVTINLNNGTYTTFANGGMVITAKVTALNDGWYLINITSTGGSADGTTLRFECWHNAATNDQQWLLAFPQLEAGAFPTSYIPSTTSFTSRATSATYFDSTGTLRIAGTNQARYGYGYDSTSGKWVSQGLLLEAAATNLLKSTISFSTADWSTPNTTVTQNATTSPDGTATAAKVAAISTTGTQNRLSFDGMVALSAGTYTFSVYAKPAQYNYVGLSMYTGTYSKATFNVATGAISNISNCFATSTPVGNGWYRISISATLSGDVLDANMASAIWPHSTDIDASQQENGDGSSGVYIWGAQLETGLVATSYIPTYGAAATRAADVSSSAATTRATDYAAINNIDSSSWFTQGKGTICAEGYFIGDDTGTVLYPGIVNLAGSNASTDAIRVYGRIVTDGSISYPAGVIYYGGSSQADIAVTGALATQNFKAAFAYQTNDCSFAANGTLGSTDTSATMPYVTQLNIFGYAGYHGPSCGYCKKISYYPKRLTNAQITALTA